MNVIQGDLIAETKKGAFDVIVHGCNCFCTMGAGIAPIMAKEFGCDNFRMELPAYKGDINKLGCIDFKKVNDVIVVNAYTQYSPGLNGRFDIPLDYDALCLCLTKINAIFVGRRIGLPFIGAGLAGGHPEFIFEKMDQIFTLVNATLVILDQSLYSIIKDYVNS